MTIHQFPPQPMPPSLLWEYGQAWGDIMMEAPGHETRMDELIQRLRNGNYIIPMLLLDFENF